MIEGRREDREVGGSGEGEGEVAGEEGQGAVV